MRYEIIEQCFITDIQENKVTLLRETFAPGVWADTEGNEVVIHYVLFTIISIDLVNGIIELDRSPNPGAGVLQLVRKVKPTKPQIINYTGNL